MSRRNRTINENREPPDIRVEPTRDGFFAEGPGFYVWDEDRSEMIRAVREFMQGCAEITPTRRMLLIPPEPIPPAAH